MSDAATRTVPSGSTRELGGGVIGDHRLHATGFHLRVEIEPEVADIRPPRAIDHHVVAVEAAMR
jgi:hypothetical protein